jgi:hypothetical protein
MTFRFEMPAAPATLVVHTGQHEIGLVMSTMAVYPDPSAAKVVPVRHEMRLRMKPHTGTHGQVDGAWWPRSDDPAVEFPDLVLAISSWVGPVRRMIYRLDDWAPTTPELVVEGWPVSLVGSTTLEANTVEVTGTDQNRKRLLVVPPGTPGGVARAVLRSAAAPDTVAGAGEILTSNGVLRGLRLVGDRTV